MSGATTVGGLPSVANAKGVRLNGAYLTALDALVGTRPPTVTGAFSMGGLYRPLTLTGPQRLVTKVDNPDLTTEAGMVAWVTPTYARMARIGTATNGNTGAYRGVYDETTAGAPTVGSWHSWGWRYDPTATNPVTPENPTGAPGRSAFFQYGTLKAEADTRGITVPATIAALVIGAKSDGTSPFLGEVSRVWVAEGTALSDAWFARAETARVFGATALSAIRTTPQSLTVTAPVGSTTPVQASLQVTQAIPGGNPNFSLTLPTRITATGSLSAPTTLALSVSPTGLTADTNVNITITPADTTQAPFTVPVLIDMISSDLVVSPTSIALNAVAGASTSNTQRLTVTQQVAGGLTGFTISTPVPWLRISQV